MKAGAPTRHYNRAKIVKPFLKVYRQFTIIDDYTNIRQEFNICRADRDGLVDCLLLLIHLLPEEILEFVNVDVGVS